MAKCAICEKAAHFGIQVSHSHRRSNKMWKANVNLSESRLMVELRECTYVLPAYVLAL